MEFYILDGGGPEGLGDGSVDLGDDLGGVVGLVLETALEDLLFARQAMVDVLAEQRQRREGGVAMGGDDEGGLELDELAGGPEVVHHVSAGGGVEHAAAAADHVVSCQEHAGGAVPQHEVTGGVPWRVQHLPGVARPKRERGAVFQRAHAHAGKNVGGDQGEGIGM